MPTSQAAPAHTHYHAFLLCLWRESEHGPWRLSLQEGVGQARIGLADVESLTDYLRWVMGQAPAPPPAQNPSVHQV